MKSRDDRLCLLAELIVHTLHHKKAFRTRKVLSHVLKYSSACSLNNSIHINIVAHHERIFSTEFQYHGSQSLCCSFHDLDTDTRTSYEDNFVRTRRHECISGLTKSGYKLNKIQRCIRSFQTRLNHFFKKFH